jgi:HEAT repeat protein
MLLGMVGVWGMTPRESVEAECGRRGLASFVDGCAGLLLGRDADDALIHALAGPAAAQVLDGREGGRSGYWPRVWAARGLLHAWDSTALPAIVAATRDESWRVREMAAKVVARHRLGDALSAVAALEQDPVPRVRAAAHRAVTLVTGN